jgi:predicted Zn-dependent peptidase
MATLEQRGLAPVRSVLDNGVRVITKHSGATPAVTVHASFDAGTVFDPPDEPGVAHFVSRTIDRGTTSHTADDIAERLDFRGVSLAITVNRQALSLVCTCLVEDLEPILATLADIVMHPAFPDREVETRRGEIVTMIRQDEDNPAAMAAEGLLSLLYGPVHPYGRPAVRQRRSNESAASHCGHFTPPALLPIRSRWSSSAISIRIERWSPPIVHSRVGRHRQRDGRNFRRSNLPLSVGCASSR